MIQPRIIRMPELKNMLGISRATIYRKLSEADGAFPVPVRLGPNSIGFRLADVEAWIATRPTAH